MRVHRSVCRVLLYGIVFGVFAFVTIPSAARVIVPSAPASTAGVLYGPVDDSSHALLQFVRGGHFCRWYPHHGLCVQLVKLPRFCDRRPNHRLCAPADDDRFCRKRPDHPLCDDDRFCRKRPDHPLCDDDPPPSPS